MQGRANTRPTHHQISTHAKKSWFSGMTAGDFADKVGLSRRFNTHGNEKELVMRKIITFLGVGHYEKTTYRYNEVDYQTQFCVAAIVNALNAIQEKPIEQVLVCVTDEAKAKNYPNLEEALQAFGVVCQPIQIPNGKNEQELWQIFRAITDQIKDDDEIWFDITNSFRSLPFVVFLVVAFLRQVQNVSVKRVLYGAYEKSVVITPILDLTKFVQLLDWMNAANRFRQQGDGDQFAELLGKNRVFGQGKQTDNKQLVQAKKHIESVSLAIRLNQPFILGKEAKKMQNVLYRASASIQELAPPFAVVLEQVCTEYEPLSTQDEDQPVDVLEKQLLMIKWYIEKNRLLQAVTLMREWLVSVHILQMTPTASLANIQNRNHRKPAEADLNESRTLLWENTGRIRNEIAHCGMSVTAAKSRAELEKHVKDVSDMLPKFENLLETVANSTP